MRACARARARIGTYLYNGPPKWHWDVSGRPPLIVLQASFLGGCAHTAAACVRPDTEAGPQHCTGAWCACPGVDGRSSSSDSRVPIYVRRWGELRGAGQKKAVRWTEMEEIRNG